MSLHKPRGSSLVEYALVLFMAMGGAAVAVKGAGIDVRDVFDEASNTALSTGSAQLGDRTPLRGGPDRRDGGN